MPDSGDLVRPRAPLGASLYDTDFYAWCLQQAEALRACAGLSDRVDWEHVAEEIDSLGASDHRACESYLVRIIEHLLKIEFLDKPENVNHHRREVLGFRRRLNRAMSPSLRAAMPNWVEPLYFDALKEASSYAHHVGRREALPGFCPYTWSDVLGREDGEWTPEPRRASD